MGLSFAQCGSFMGREAFLIRRIEPGHSSSAWKVKLMLMSKPSIVTNQSSLL